MSVPTDSPGPDNVPLAVVAILVSVLALSAGDAVIKLTSAHLPIWQIYVLRSAAIVPILLLLLRMFAMLIGSIGAAVAYQSGPAPVVATFDYAYLVFAALWGALLFAKIPDLLTLLGMLMITVGGVLAVRGRHTGDDGKGRART